MKKRIIVIALSLVVVCGFIFGGYWTVANLPVIMSSSAIYTDTDMEKAREDGYNAGKGDKERLEAQIIEQQQTIRTLQTDLSEKQNYLDDAVDALLESELDNEKKQQLLEDAQNQIYDLQLYITELNDLVIQYKTAYINALQEIANLELTIQHYEETITAYEALIASLQDEIINQRFVIRFLFDDFVEGLVMVPVGSKLDIGQIPSTVTGLNDYSVFMGWSLTQGGELVDFETWVPDADAALYAVVQMRYLVTFNTTNAAEPYPDNGIIEVIIDRGACPSVAVALDENSPPHTVINPVSSERKIFLGWSVNGVDILDPNTYAIYDSTVFLAVIETRHLVRFNVPTKGNLQTTYNNETNPIVPPTSPVYPGYSFDGWYLNGSKITDLANYRVLGDLIFYAKYIPVTQTVSGFPVVIRDGYEPGATYSLSDYLPTGLYGSVTIKINIFNNNPTSSSPLYEGGGPFYHTLTLSSKSVTEQYDELRFYGFDYARNIYTWMYTYDFYKIEFLYDEVDYNGNHYYGKGNFRLRVSTFWSDNDYATTGTSQSADLRVTITSISFTFPNTIKV